MSLRVLYSFPHRLGAGRICSIAWQQAHGVAATGADVTVLAGSVARPLPARMRTRTTHALGRVRMPVRLAGRERICAWHDWRAARWLDAHHREIDVFHGWPLASLRTLRAARRHGIRTYLERPNTHTAFAYEVAGEENARVGLEHRPGANGCRTARLARPRGRRPARSRPARAPERRGCRSRGRSLSGPNGGRVIEIEGGHAEFFVQPDKKIRVTLLDEENKVIAPADQKVSAIAEAPAGKAKLAFAVADGAFVSDSAIPDGEYRIVLQIRSNAEAKPQNTRIDYNAAICGECKRPEYACTCTGGGEAHAH